MIERSDSFGIGDNYVVHCDSCPEYAEFEEVFNFAELLKLVKALGWLIIYEAGWKHFCPACKEEK